MTIHYMGPRSYFSCSLWAGSGQFLQDRSDLAQAWGKAAGLILLPLGM